MLRYGKERLTGFHHRTLCSVAATRRGLYSGAHRSFTLLRRILLALSQRGGSPARLQQNLRAHPVPALQLEHGLAGASGDSAPGRDLALSGHHVPRSSSVSECSLATLKANRLVGAVAGVVVLLAAAGGGAALHVALDEGAGAHVVELGELGEDETTALREGVGVGAGIRRGASFSFNEYS